MQDDAIGLDRALEGEGWLGRVAIPPGKTEAFAAMTLMVRRRALSMSVLIGTGFYIAFAFGDTFAVPDQLRLALTFRFGVMLPAGLAVFYWLHRTRCSLMYQQCVTCGFHLMAVGLLALLMMRSESVNALGFVFANYAVLMAMVISMALPMRVVVVLSLVVVLIQAVAIAHGPLGLPVLELHNLMIAIVIIGPAIFANRTLENERRRHFLLVEREQLRQRQLAEAARPTGRVGRMGGEEFAVFVANVNEDALPLYAERLRAGVQRLNLEHHHSTAARVMTISVGVVTGYPETAEIKTLFEAADAALYQAKAAGRNRVVIHDSTRLKAGVRRSG